MASVQHVVIELFVILLVVNSFLGVFTLIYQEKEPTSSLRSPFNTYPLGGNFTSLDVKTTTDKITRPTNSTGSVISWVDGFSQNFNATIETIYVFSAFFTLGFLTQLLSTLGLPDHFEIIIGVPFAVYSMIMIFSIITGRLRD